MLLPLKELVPDPLNLRQPEDDLLVADGPTHTANDFVPMMDQETPVASYTDWDPANTRVLTCRIANDLYPGERYESRDEAVAAVTRKYGRIYEANYTPGRAFFRIARKTA